MVMSTAAAAEKLEMETKANFINNNSNDVASPGSPNFVQQQQQQNTRHVEPQYLEIVCKSASQVQPIAVLWMKEKKK